MKSAKEVALSIISESASDTPEQTHEKLTKHYRSREGVHGPITTFRDQPDHSKEVKVHGWAGGLLHKTDKSDSKHLKKMGFGKSERDGMSTYVRHHPNGTQHTLTRYDDGSSHSEWHHPNHKGSWSLPEVDQERKETNAAAEAYQNRHK